jgi:equilibrative nucleoside transporter 1/2/3
MAIEPVNPWFHPLLFSGLHILLFSVGDLFGRHLCSFPSLLIWSPYRLLRLSFAHTLFVPLFVACNIQLSPSRPQLSLLYLHPLGSGLPPSPLINSDLVFFLILFAFGTSNGYVSSLCLMAASSLEHNKELRDEEDVDTAATIGLFCMVSGITLGSFFSFGIRAVVCRCNPFVG